MRPVAESQLIIAVAMLGCLAHGIEQAADPVGGAFQNDLGVRYVGDRTCMGFGLSAVGIETSG